MDEGIGGAPGNFEGTNPGGNCDGGRGGGGTEPTLRGVIDAGATDGGAGRPSAAGNCDGARDPAGGRTLSSLGASAGRAWLGTSGGMSGETG